MIALEIMRRMTRRNFIKQTAVAALLIPPCSFFLLKAAEAFAGTDTNYYLLHKNKLTRAFQETLDGARQFWAPEFGAAKAGQMAQQATALFKNFCQSCLMSGERQTGTPSLFLLQHGMLPTTNR